MKIFKNTLVLKMVFAHISEFRLGCYTENHRHLFFLTFERYSNMAAVTLQVLAISSKAKTDLQSALNEGLSN